MKRDMIHGFLNRKVVAAVAAIAFAFGLSSCIKDTIPDTYIPDELTVDGKVKLVLHTHAGSYQVPVTRIGKAENDDDDGVVDSYGAGRMPLILVFELPEGKMENYEDAGDAAAQAELLRTTAVFKEAALAEMDGATAKVMLSITERPVRLLIVSDPPQEFFYNDGAGDNNPDFTPAELNGSESPLKGKTFAEAVTGILNTLKLSTGDNGHVENVPYTGTGEYIPATGIHDLPKVDANVSAIGAPGAEVWLQRIAAKITVVNDADGFVFEGASVLESKRYGYLYRDTTSRTPEVGLSALPEDNKIHYLKGNTGTPDNRVIGIAPSSSSDLKDGDTRLHPLYVYESAAGEIVVLVQGQYKGTTYWYRLSLKGADGEAMAVDRNKHYTLTIKEVDIAGCSTIADALTMNGTHNIPVSVISSELSGHEIVDNGSYYLGLSNSVFIHWSNDTERSEVLTTISTNAPSSTAISVTKIAGDDGITLDASWATNKSATGVESNVYEVKAKFTPTFIADGKKALYNIKVGTLEKQLLVMQYGTVLHVGETETELTGMNYVAASVEEGEGWLSLAMKDGTSGTYSDYTTEAVNSNIGGGIIKITSKHHKVETGQEVRFVFGSIMASHSPKTPFTETVGADADAVMFKNTGGRVKISIGQLKVIEPRFARSNVVLYIDDEGNRILTFAEVPEDHTSKTVKYGNGKSVTLSGSTAILANAQGIHFRWGGLIGMSSSHTSTTNSVTDFDGNNDIQFWPAEYVAKCKTQNSGRTPDQVTWKFTWDESQWADATEVPYLGDPSLPTVASPVPYTYDAFDVKYGSKGYDAEEGYGDICRYISDKGWVEGRWRMPKHQEIQYLLYDETRYAELAYNTYLPDEASHGIMYGEFTPYYRNIGGTMQWVDDFTILPVYNPLQGDSHCYGFTPMTNARIVGAGITPDDKNHTEYLTNPPGTRMVVPAAGCRESGRFWTGADGDLYYTGGNGYFWTSRTPTLNQGGEFHVNWRALHVTGRTREYGHSIRCIRKLESEP